MKKLNKTVSLILTTILLVSGFVACGSDDDDAPAPPTKEQEEVLYNKYVNAEVEKVIDEFGLNINRGTNPPNIEGYYIFEPYCIKSNNPNETQLNHIFVPHLANYFNQVGLTLEAKAYDAQFVEHIGTGSFISGEGNKFSVFFEEDNNSTINGIRYTQKALTIYSGEIVRDKNNKIAYIKDFQWLLLVTDTGGNPLSLPAYTGRLFVPANDGQFYVADKEVFDEVSRIYNQNKKLNNTESETITERYPSMR